MLLPKMLNNDFFTGWFDPFNEPFFNDGEFFGQDSKKMMKTDVHENDSSYVLDIDLPGFKKEDISASLKNGYMTISAQNDSSKEEKDKDGKLIRQERYFGSMNRSFYVGSQIKQEDIKAKFADGVLTLTVPKNNADGEIESNNLIAIEG